MLLFLDFDGVVHPRSGSPFDVSCIGHIERALTAYPETRIVITSSWREHYPVEQLKKLLGAELGNRVAGVTPSIRGTYTKYVRHEEVLQYLKDTDISDCMWIALDDSPEFYPDTAPVIWVDGVHGVTEHEVVQLQAALRVLSYHSNK